MLRGLRGLLPHERAGCIAPAAMMHSRPSIDRSIVLVGLMGVGKSTVGRRLAKRLGLEFADSDSEIEAAAGYTINEIFERFGEASFRDGERRVIARLVAGPPKVIATGGGAFIDPQTRALILDRCTAIWIDADILVLAERVSRRDSRPLLKNRKPAEVLSELAAIRNPIYAEAHIHVRSSPTPHDNMVEQILKALDERVAGDRS
jgi:shikimate kinase